jgi:tetratricopeptide (TPR) repeat protein
MSSVLEIDSEILNLILVTIVVLETLILIYIQRKYGKKQGIDKNTKEVIEQILEKVPTPLDPNNPLDITKEEIDNIRKIEFFSDFTDAIVLIKIGNIEFTKGNVKKAIEKFEEACEKAEKQNNLELKSVCIGNIGMIYKKIGNYKRALAYLNSALKIQKEIGDKKGEANSVGNIGIIYRNMGLNENSLKYHKNALTLHKDIKDKIAEAKDLMNIGIVYQSKGDSKKALNYLKNSLKMNREINNLEGEASALTNIGGIFAQSMKDYNKSIKYLNDALMIHKIINFKEGEAMTLGILGLLYKKIGEAQEAKKYLKSSLAIMRKYRISQGIDIFKKALEKIEKLPND